MMKRLIFSVICCLAMLVASAQRINGSWNGKLQVGMNALTVVIHIEGDSCTMDSPDQGAFGLPAQLKKCTADSLVVEFPQMKVVYEGVKVANEIRGTFTQMGHGMPLTLKAGKPVYNRPQTPQPPFPYKTEEVTFVNPHDQASLSGTISYPVDYERGKTPVVLLVTGSGLQNRDEEIFEHRPFAVIADYLARNGVATLRYDDRSVGKSTGDVKNATTATYAQDAEAGLKYLRDTKAFGKVGLLGHSEGGTIAFILAGAGKTDFIVSLAGTAIRGDKVLVGQNRLILPTQGVPEAMAEDYCKALEKVYVYKIAYGAMAKANSQMIVSMAVGETKVSLPEQLRANLVTLVETDNAWINYFVSYDPAEAIKAIKCPVMAVNGTKDIQVIVNDNLPVLRALLPHKEGDVIKEYEGLNHLFQHCKNGSTIEYIKIEETISPEVLSDIVTFVQK